MKFVGILFLSAVSLYGQFDNAKKIWGRPVVSTAPSDGQTYQWNAANSRWQLAPGSAAAPNAGVITGTAAVPICTVPAGTNAITTCSYTASTNITSATLTGGLTAGQIACFRITQDGTGGWTNAFPTNVLNFSAPDTTASAVTTQCGIYDGTNVNASSNAIVTGLGGQGQGFTCVEGTAPANPAAGSLKLYCKTADNSMHVLNSAGTDIVIGAGTVSVVSSGTLANTACVTGGGSQTLQTPTAAGNCNIDASGNIISNSLRVNSTSSTSIDAAGNIRTASGNSIYWTNSSRLVDGSNGNLQLLDALGTNWSKLQFGGTTASYPGLLRSGNALGIRNADGTIATYSTLTACASGLNGAMAAISDSTTATMGATISGGGSLNVQAYCNGTNWVVGNGGSAAAAAGGASGWSGLPLTFATTTTQYAPFVGGGLPSATETAVSTKASGAATISKLHVTVDVALGADVVLTVTLEDGTATASTLTCSTSAGGTSCDDTTHSVNVADQDLLSWKLVKTSGTVTAGLPQIKISYAVGTSGVGVTSVGFTGGLISVATATTTPAFTVAGTSGGIPYFDSSSTWLSSSVLSANRVMLGGGAGAAPTVTGADTTTTHALFATAGAPAFRALAAGDIPSTLTSGTAITNAALTMPAIGAATGASLLLTGIMDGKAPLDITTGATANLGGTYNSGYTINQEATAGTGVTYTLPATAVGKQYCVKNGDVTGTARTGVLTVAVPASSYLHLNGARGTISSNITSGGAAGDAACFVAIDATNWEVYVNVGTWTLH